MTSGYRVAEGDRALTAVGTLLMTYGRFAFDAAEAASTVREGCEEWAKRLVFGEGRAAKSEGGAETGVNRDFRGVERFFEEMRKSESSFVTEQIAGLRKTVISLARTLGNGVGEDRDADAKVEQGLSALSRAVEQDDIQLVTRAATSVILSCRSAMAQRRQRETRNTEKLDQELRSLRDRISSEYDSASTDELTGLYGRVPYDQQLDQLTALGALLTEPPWLLLIDVAAGKRDPKRAKAVPDATLREVSHCISRTFLRRHDFAARSGAHELAVLVVDMTQAEVVAATERLLGVVHNAGRQLGKTEVPNVAIGLARLRPNDDASRWHSRARVAVERAIQDDREGYSISAG
ncbi:MAG TPA: diguanylate cyclase [Polyangiaceae bacterium]|nr:diguanylate cyclase [Polyangiaceae bacterium]